jgi:uncharacterized protein YbaA (DUF1428 family)
MPYVDAYVIPVKKKDVNTYAKMAKRASKVYMESGALEFRECVCDELSNKWGSGFAKQLKLKPNETVYFSWVVFKSKAARNAINKKIMKDPRMQQIMKEPMVFDMKRFMNGGCKIMVDAKR